MNLEPYIVMSNERGQWAFEVRLKTYDDCGGETYLTLATLESEDELCRFIHYIKGGSRHG
jgi:hypothetical protein